MHGYPTWVLWVFYCWPLILGVVFGAIGQAAWWWWMR